LRSELVERAGVALVREAGAVEVGRGDDLGLKERLLAREVEAREFGGGAGLGEAGFKRGELTGAGAFFEIGEAGLGGGDLVGGLALRGEFAVSFEREELGAGGNPGAFGDGEEFEAAGERRGDVDEFAFEVALPADGCGA